MRSLYLTLSLVSWGLAFGAQAEDARIQSACPSMAVPLAFDDKTHGLWYDRFWTGDCARGLAWCHKGTPNWLGVMNDLQREAPAGQRASLKKRLCGLGQKVGLEWARDNSIRTIDTAALGRFYKILQDGSKDPLVRTTQVETQAAAMLTNSRKP
ncbi:MULTISPECIES: hypothetical protein [Asticcacaulis]|uniref:hypothetical protein n=1 Tax=Asticcacaulis TaxID=76890 RepID=UPI001AE540F2|nr:MULTISPECIES: hypothetical protein [Asticcacaulis]MBP2161332.1 hypothetical protein [Asticcacaulis solisilvae]MDR6802302.1 hypothetical protein [Asticcacaulis sp. BE141]